MPDTVEPEVIVNAVLGKVSDVLINGDGTVIPKSDDHFLAFMSPGTPLLNDDFNYAIEGFGGVYRRNVKEDDLEASTGPQEQPAEGPGEPSIDQLLAADALQKYMRAEAVYNVADQIPDVAGIIDAGRINTWNPEARVSRLYAMALQQSQVYDNEPDEAARNKLDRWRSKLIITRKERDIVTDEEVEVTEESELVRRYNEKMQAYLAAAMDYNNVRISAMAGKDQEAVHRLAINGPLLQMKVRAALNDWSDTGHKGDLEKLIAAIQSVEERAFTLLKQRYKEDYARSLLTNPSSGSNFLYTAPAIASFAREGSGWSEFYFNSSSFASNHSFRDTSTAAGGGFHVGTFGIAGGGEVTKHKYQGNVDTKTFRLRFKMARVPISRPWLNLDFITSGYWRFDQNNEVVRNMMISDGQQPPNGLMPAITTDFIFVKDVELHLGESHSDFLRHTQNVTGTGGVTFGSLHLGARHSDTSGSWSANNSWTDQGIKIRGLQLLGFVCFLLPKSPDPHPGITEWI